jgi:hypothetical protein
MFQIETPGVLNGYLVFPEHVTMNNKNINITKIPSFVHSVRKIIIFVSK